MKTVTDLEQSKVLAKILPIGSADIVYIVTANDDNGDYLYTAEIKSEIIMYDDKDNIPAWSLSALLDVLSEVDDSIELLRDHEDWHLMDAIYDIESSCPIDACVEMIMTLKERGLL